MCTASVVMSKIALRNCTILRSTAPVAPLLGQPVSGSAHRRCLRLDAGVEIAGCRYRLCPRSSLHVARTTAKAGCTGIGLSTTSRRSSAGFLPVSASVSLCGPGARLRNRISTFSQITNSTKICTGNGHGIPVSSIQPLGIRVSELCDPSLDQPQLPDHYPVCTTDHRW